MRQNQGDENVRGKKEEGQADYLRDIGSNKNMMRKPDPGASLSWRYYFLKVWLFLVVELKRLKEEVHLLKDE